MTGGGWKWTLSELVKGRGQAHTSTPPDQPTNPPTAHHPHPRKTDHSASFDNLRELARYAGVTPGGPVGRSPMHYDTAIKQHKPRKTKAPHGDEPGVARAASTARRAGVRSWMLFDMYGGMREMQMDKHQMMRMTSVPGRDLRILDPVSHSPAAILCRHNALVVNLEHIKLILLADQVMVLIPPGSDTWQENSELAAFVEILKMRVLGAAVGVGPGEAPAAAAGARQASRSVPITRSPRGLGPRRSQDDQGLCRTESDGEDRSMRVAKHLAIHSGYCSDGDEEGWQARGQRMQGHVQDYFEFRVLEAALEAVCALLDHRAADLEQVAYPALDSLVQRVTSHKLELVRQVKSNMTRLISRVSQVKEELQHLLEDDSDMNEMYLTRKQVAEIEMETPGGSGRGARNHAGGEGGAGAGPVDVQELEDLLEAFNEQINGTFNRLATLREYVDDMEDFISISQDSHRNQLIKTDLILTAATFSMAMLGMVAGVFGMNVPNDLEDADGAFAAIVGTSVLVGLLAFAVFIWFLQRQQLV